MTDDRNLTDEQAMLAAEYALGILDGAELVHARALAANDSAFRREVERWRGRLAPMLDDAPPVDPPSHVKQSVAIAVEGLIPPPDNVVRLQRRVSAWQGVAAAMSAIAACLAILLVVQPRQFVRHAEVQAPSAPPLVAMVGDEKQMKLVASWDPAGRRLVLAVAGDMPADPSHSHELWVIPSDGKPRSLGTMGGGKQMHMSLEQALATLMRQGATIAISVEPPGGSPTGAPTGPVIASGTLHTA